MIKIGVFGAWRGNAYIRLFQQDDEMELVAICDKNIDSPLDEDRESFGDAALCSSFDDFLKEGKERGMNTVFLANYFHEHALFAIRAMQAGMDVVSECTAAATLAQCVALTECVEQTGRRYMLAENYPFSTENLKMKQIIRSGALGSLLYAQGEYNHSGSNEELHRLTPGAYHWRAWLPRTYYLTHALGPIMYMTDSMPVYVCGRAAHSDLLYKIKDWRHNYDGVGMMFCEMDNGMIANFTGCTAMASDYSRYRVAGDTASVEWGGYIENNKVRKFYFGHTKPADEPQISLLDANLDETDDEEKKAKNAGHGGGDYRVLHEIKEYLLRGREPFFNVYRAVAMSATAILGWYSCLNHGENIRIPDFRVPVQRDSVREDTRTPFPDENGAGISLPCALPLDFSQAHTKSAQDR